MERTEPSISREINPRVRIFTLIFTSLILILTFMGHFVKICEVRRYK